MMVVALTGISGVGKSTLVEAVSSLIPLHHFQASALIKEGRDTTLGVAAVAHDHLRLANTDENQMLLVRGFRRRAVNVSGLVILDGHTMIEKDDRLMPIAKTVFEEIGISAMIFLEDDPAFILERRRGDTSRSRPLPSIERLKATQDAALRQAAELCEVLEIQLHVRGPSEIEAIALTLKNLKSNDG